MSRLHPTSSSAGPSNARWQKNQQKQEPICITIESSDSEQEASPPDSDEEGSHCSSVSEEQVSPQRVETPSPTPSPPYHRTVVKMTVGSPPSKSITKHNGVQKSGATPAAPRSVNEPSRPSRNHRPAAAAVVVSRPKRTASQAGITQGPSKPETPSVALTQPRSKAGTSVAEPEAGPKCILCERSGSDRVRFFQMEKEAGVNAHYLCMFTASNLTQTGDPRNKSPGIICGFNTTDVIKEQRRASRLRCKYCKKNGAAVGCVVRTCKAMYHYPCGAEHKCFFSFTGKFESYCPAHIPAEQIPRPVDLNTVNRDCVVCFDKPDLRDKMDCLITPCCNRALHRECVSGVAVNAGKHYIKCPACNDSDGFRAFCHQVGIHVPNADATWLKEVDEEQNQQEEQQPEVKCAAEQCVCPRGLEYDEDVPGRDWNIERCHLGCGKLMHAGCMQHIGRKGANRQNYCSECYGIEMKIQKQMGRRLATFEREPSEEIPEIQLPRTRKARKTTNW